MMKCMKMKMKMKNDEMYKNWMDLVGSFFSLNYLMLLMASKYPCQD